VWGLGFGPHPGTGWRGFRRLRLGGHRGGLGAIGAVPPGEGVVEGGTTPYLPVAAARRKENYQRRWTADPEIKCFMPGVPRATYLPYPFQIVQGANTILSPTPTPGPYAPCAWAILVRVLRTVGWVGRWDIGRATPSSSTSPASTIQTWFDRAGNFHSDALRVVERYTPRGPDILDYEASIEDPRVSSRPWKIGMPLYRHVEKNAHLMEYQCIPYPEDVPYGHLRRAEGGSK
jgi:hypothetical protein